MSKLTNAWAPEEARILTRENANSLVKRIYALAHGGGDTWINALSWWSGELRWSRNRVSMASDRRDMVILVSRMVHGGIGYAETNQSDDASLEGAVRAAERLAKRRSTNDPADMERDLTDSTSPVTKIWSDASYDATAETRAHLVETLTSGAEAKGMLSAGYMEVSGMSGLADSNTGFNLADGMRPPLDTLDGLPTRMKYDAWTLGQCSMTVRDPKGSGSGWAGLAGYDWGAIDSNALAERALQKCIASLNPVRIEPGRYTVILEPQAVCDLVDLLMGNQNFERPATELGSGPFVQGPDDALKINRTKLGLKIMDERITISHDPTDPLLGVYPEIGEGPVTWIDKGVLKTLNYTRYHAETSLNRNASAITRPSYRMSGGETSIDEMIATTKRGLLVTRFSNLAVLDGRSVLATGLTRDGLWLIENGKISKAVNNMRITESPLFVLNQVRQLGVPVPVFRIGKYKYGYAGPWSAIVPPIKADDFSFTATIDAI
jgi:predicted Zn-dependent protease